LNQTAIRCNENGIIHALKGTAMTRGDRPPPLAIFDRCFSRHMKFTRFVLNVLLFSCLGLLPFLILYISLRPGFWSSLIADPLARNLLLRQVATNGLPVVYLINHVGFALYAGLADRERGALRALAIDLPTRIVLFFVAHAAIYAGSARMFGSFGGDAVQALGVVGPTIAGSAAFGNLSGVYLYATAISAYPLFVAAMWQLADAQPKRFGPLASVGQGPWMLSVLFVMAFVLLAFATSGLAALLSLLAVRG
jgi:hypothetical protein